MNLPPKRMNPPKRFTQSPRGKSGERARVKCRTWERIENSKKQSLNSTVNKGGKIITINKAAMRMRAKRMKVATAERLTGT